MRFEVKAWMTKSNNFNRTYNNNTPVPMRVMFGKIVRETDKCYIVELYGKPEPASHCLHCMRKLTHKVSMYYGLGPICGKHYYISDITEDNLQEHFEEIRNKMANIRWRGLIPKNAVKLDYEDFHSIEFMYNGKRYRTTTSDTTKVKEIYDKSDSVLSDNIVKG